MPYRGTSKTSPTSPSPTTPVVEGPPKAPPKKGSFAEIMARGPKSSQPAVGAIRHKPREALSAKKELLLRKKGIIPNGKSRPSSVQDGVRSSKSVSPAPGSTKAKVSEITAKKIPPSGYKGTASVKPQPNYKGTMKSASVLSPARRKGSDLDEHNRRRSSSGNGPSRQQEHASEEESDEQGEEEGNPYSDESDDMEAGFSDVEEEEVAAAKAAKKEDAEELRLENELKRQKEERRKKLAAMAAKAPKPRY